LARVETKNFLEEYEEEKFDLNVIPTTCNDRLTKMERIIPL
jgi:hypothetical protein